MNRPDFTRREAIRAFCYECMGYQMAPIRECTDEPCPLWPYRMGAGKAETDRPLRSGHSNRLGNIERARLVRSDPENGGQAE